MRKFLASFLALALLHSNVQAAAVQLKVAAKTGVPVTIVTAGSLPTLHVQKGLIGSNGLPVLTPKIGAQPVLVEMTAQIDASKQNGGTPEAVLNASFDASAAKTGAADLTLGSFGSGMGGGKNLSPFSGGNGGGATRNFSEPPSGGSNKKKIGIIAAVVGGLVAVAVVVMLVINSGKKQNELFESSPANADIVLVEQAQRANDAKTLDSLSENAQKRQKTLKEQIADAKSRGKKELADGTPLDKAEAYAAFDGLVIARAELAENAATADAGERIGLTAPNTFVQGLRQAEADAQASGFEGNLAVELDKRQAELSSQQANREAVKKQLDAYNSKVPTAGGRMGELSRKASQELSQFDASEASAEQAAVNQARVEMRARVTVKLEQDPQFRSISKRAENLQTVKTGEIDEARRHVRAGEQDLRDAAAAYKDAVANDKLAKDNKEVKVTKEIKDANGNVIDTVTVVEDHSAPYEKKAAESWATAKAKKESAQTNITNLNRTLAKLRENQTLQGVNLDDAVPSNVRSWYDYDELEKGLGAVEITRKNLDKLDTSVGEKQAEANKQKERLIDEELDAQKQKAKRGW